MKEEYKVYFSGKDFKGEGIYNLDDGTLKLLKGSVIVKDETNSFRQYYQSSAKIKDELIERAIIVDNEFMEDYIFDIPFHASSILSSYGISGNKAWKTREGKDIDQIKKAYKNIDIFKKYYKDFKLDKDVEEIKKAIEEFNRQFPLEELPDLKIEEYDKLGSKKTLTYAIEHGTNIVSSGFLGVNRNKIVYNYKDDEYDCIEALKNKYPEKSVEEIYKLYIESIYKFISEFDKENYSKGEIGALPENTNTIRSKLLMLYRPGEILRISSMEAFKKIFDYFALDYRNMDSVMMNIKLQDFMEEIGFEYSDFKLDGAIWRFYQDVILGEEPPIKPKNFQDLFLKDSFIEEIVSVLKRKKAIIFRGVPGVGKTFVIKDIIRNSFENIAEDGIETIQFHQSYSYEEFVEGLRPQMAGGFNIEKGIFYNICDNARGNPESNYFLIIDEINRGNMSKIFGELLMLIENDKRDEYAVRLPYSKEEFTVPSNLYIIGTMNTADRSLALVDYAMRRRFSFITLEPAFATDKFNRYLKEKMELDQEFINDLNIKMTRVNKIIRDRLGEDFIIGHSYFIENIENISDVDKWYEEIVKYEIIPMVEEYFFDDINSIEEIKNILGGKDE